MGGRSFETTEESTDNQDHTLRFRRDTHGSTFPCFFKILFFFKGFSKSCDNFTTQMCLGVICTAPYAHGSTFKTTNMPTCTRSQHTISRCVHMSKCSTYFASHISPWSRRHLLAGNNADHCNCKYKDNPPATFTALQLAGFAPVILQVCSVGRLLSSTAGCTLLS